MKTRIKTLTFNGSSRGHVFALLMRSGPGDEWKLGTVISNDGNSFEAALGLAVDRALLDQPKEMGLFGLQTLTLGLAIEERAAPPSGVAVVDDANYRTLLLPEGSVVHFQALMLQSAEIDKSRRSSCQLYTAAIVGGSVEAALGVSVMNAIRAYPGMCIIQKLCESLQIESGD